VNARLRVTEASIPAMTPLPEIQRVSDAPHTMVANNPTSKRICKINPALTNVRQDEIRLVHSRKSSDPSHCQRMYRSE
jgi:hypothetical protein